MKMTCQVTPYEGSDAYLFFSFCHDDEAIAYPLMERLARAGVRIWYDSGIVAGSEWPEVIAAHLERCHACLILISDAAAASHNCRNEMNYAVQAKKALIPVNYCDVKLTLGMKLMIGSTQWITLSEYPKEEEIARILASEAIKPCQGIQDHRIVAQPFHIHGVEVTPAPVPRLEKPIRYDPKTDDEQNKDIPGQEGKEEPEDVPQKKGENGTPGQGQQEGTKPVTHSGAKERSGDLKTDEPGSGAGNTGAVSGKPVDAQTDGPGKAPGGYLPGDEQPDPGGGETVIDGPGISGEDEYEATIKDADIPPTILRLSNGVKYRGQNGQTTIGRSKKCEVYIADPSRKISNEHARLYVLEGMYMVTDLNSTNGTWVNGELIDSKEQIQVEDLVELRLSSEYLLVAFGERANELWRAPYILCLRSEETGEARYVYKGKLELGRNDPWKRGAMRAKNIGHTHATIEVSETGACITDHSKNGTFLNDERIESNQPFELVTGDRIRLGDEHFVAVLIQPEKGGAI